MHANDHSALPAMSYTSVEAKPGGALRPTDEAIRERAHEIWLARDGAPGNPTLDWLQAEMELVAEMRSGKPARVATKSAGRARAATEIEKLPETPRTFARGDAQWNVPRASAA